MELDGRYHTDGGLVKGEIPIRVRRTISARPGSGIGLGRKGTFYFLNRWWETKENVPFLPPFLPGAVLR